MQTGDAMVLDGAAPGGVVLDGAALHRSVPPERWCVTRKDLVQFRRLVRARVAEGSIAPTELDPFDPTDELIGPCVHTVNAQLIQPVTARAGNVSWALMLHPDGLSCDLFITHCWQEGMYEFIDKALNSWPRGTRHAYCCMLSNPQNLDIADLIGSPRESPFAKALLLAPYMLVIPNSRTSVYTRIWCVYEAFLGYSESKIILTASAPTPKVRRHGLLVLFEIAATCAICIPYLTSRVEFDSATGSGVLLDLDVLTGSVMTFLRPTALLCMCILSSIGPSRCAHGLVYLVAALAGIILAMLGYGLVRMLIDVGFKLSNDGFILANVNSFIMAVFFCWACVLAEADVSWCAQARKESRELRKGYTGGVQDAASTVPEDKQNILGEIESSPGVEDEVNIAVQVLLTSGISTPSLRETVKRTGMLAQAAYWNASAVMFFVTNRAMYSLNFLLLLWEETFHFRKVSLLGFCLCLPASTPCAEGCLADAECVLDPVQLQPLGEVLGDEVLDNLILMLDSCKPVTERSVFWSSAFGVVLTLAWLLALLLMRSYRRAFAAGALVKMETLVLIPFNLVTLTLTLIAQEVDPHALEDFLVFLNLGLGILVLGFTLAGPLLTAKVPLVGPLVVRFFMARSQFECHCFAKGGVTPGGGCGGGEDRQPPADEEGGQQEDLAQGGARNDA